MPKAPLEKLNGQSAKNGYLKIVQRGDPLGRQEVESLRRLGGGGGGGGGGCCGRLPFCPSLNPLLLAMG